MLEILSIESKAALREESVDIGDLDNWDKHDYERYEAKCLQGFVYTSWRSESLRERLSILDYQLQQMNEINQSASQSNSQQDYREKAMEAAAKGDVKTLKRLFKQNQQEEIEFRQQVIDKIIDDLMLADQVDELKAIAKFKRMIMEAKLGDEFGACVAWSKSFASDDFDSSKLEKAVKSVRKKYYEEVEKLFQTAAKETMRLLTDDARENFKSNYGEFYDYRSEVASRWNSFASQN